MRKAAAGECAALDEKGGVAVVVAAAGAGGDGKDCDEGRLVLMVARRLWNPTSSAEGPAPAAVRSTWNMNTASRMPSATTCCTMRSCAVKQGKKTKVSARRKQGHFHVTLGKISRHEADRVAEQEGFAHVPFGSHLQRLSDESGKVKETDCGVSPLA